MTETRTAHDVITDVVSTWRGTEAGTGSRGEWSFTVGRKEIGHLHGSHAAHFAFPKGVWHELKEQGRIEDHPVFPGRAGLARAPDRERGRRPRRDRAAAPQLRPGRRARCRAGGGPDMQGIVTGASRGLGLALTRALVERGWQPRRRRARRGRARTRGRRSRRRDRDRGRRRRPRPPAPPRRGCRRPDRPPRQQRQRARPDAAAAARATTTSTRCARSTR